MNPPRFRIHLSTAIALMIVAGAVLLANLNSEHYRVKDKFGGTTEYTSFGWPLSVQQLVLSADPEEPEFGPLSPLFFVIVVLYDLGFAVGSLIASFIVSEHFMRRRDAKTA